MGLMGCVRKLKIGRRLVELHEGQDAMVERVFGVRECGENPCSSLPCLHGATCHAIDSDKFWCACTPEYSGQNNVKLLTLFEIMTQRGEILNLPNPCTRPWGLLSL
jgi:hypothetical protein